MHMRLLILFFGQFLSTVVRNSEKKKTVSRISLRFCKQSKNSNFKFEEVGFTSLGMSDNYENQR